jgi:hypothetical protein
LQQGEAFVGVPIGNSDYFNAFLADGTINFDAGQILYRVAFNSADDYNLNTGLQTVTGTAVSSSGAGTDATAVTGRAGGPAAINRTFIAKECYSTFAKGKFTQELKGYWLTDGVNKSFTAPPAEPSETVRKAEAPTADGSDNRFTRLGTGAGAKTASETEIAVVNSTPYQNQYGSSPSVNTAPIIASNETPALLPASPPPITETAAVAPPPKLGSGGYGFGLRADPTAPVTAGNPQTVVKDA